MYLEGLLLREGKTARGDKGTGGEVRGVRPCDVTVVSTAVEFAEIRATSCSDCRCCIACYCGLMTYVITRVFMTEILVTE